MEMNLWTLYQLFLEECAFNGGYAYDESVPTFEEFCEDFSEDE